MPITWKNVQSDYGDAALAAAKISELGSSNVTAGIRGLAGNLEDYRTDKTDKNTSAYLDQLAGYGSAEELDAARQSGVLANMRSGFGDFIDPNALRGAADTRRNELFAEGTATRNRANADYTHGQNQLKQSLAPVQESIQAAINNHEYAKARAIALENKEGLTNIGVFGDIVGTTNTAEKSRFDYQETERLEEQTKINNGLVATALQADDSSAGRNQLREAMIANGIPADMQTQTLTNFDKQFESTRGLTALQKRNKAELGARVDQSTKYQTDYAIRKNTEDLNNLPIPKLFQSPGDMSRGKAADYMADNLGIKSKDSFTELDTGLNDVLNSKFPDGVPANLDAIKGTLIVEAARLIGTDTEWLDFDDSDLDYNYLGSNEDQVKDVFSALLNQYESNVNIKLKREQLNQGLEETIKGINAYGQQQIDEQTTRQKEQNRPKKK
tara:strand:- start:7985 stop:9310 length:1326 start_codon:yes stop_codon:yes gene_type:complete